VEERGVQAVGLVPSAFLAAVRGNGMC